MLKKISIVSALLLSGVLLASNFSDTGTTKYDVSCYDSQLAKGHPIVICEKKRGEMDHSFYTKELANKTYNVTGSVTFVLSGKYNP